VKTFSWYFFCFVIIENSMVVDPAIFRWYQHLMQSLDNFFKNKIYLISHPLIVLDSWSYTWFWTYWNIYLFNFSIVSFQFLSISEILTTFVIFKIAFMPLDMSINYFLRINRFWLIIKFSISIPAIFMEINFFFLLILLGLHLSSFYS